jgi:formylglycine-generating enzyme required for sulfatase activity
LAWLVSSGIVNPGKGTPDENVEQSNQPPVLFIAYSKKDKEFFNQLKIHLNVLNALCVADVWDDTQIMPGNDWREEIKRSLSRARVAILLVSENFLANDFILKQELPALDQAASEKRLSIYWILVSECTWQLVPAIERIQSAIPGNPSLTSMSYEDRNKVLVNIVKQIHEYLTTVKQASDSGQIPKEPNPSPLIPTYPPSLAPIPATRGWLVRDGNEWRKETKKIKVNGYKEQLADGIAITMIQIPKGQFLMGSPTDEAHRSSDEGPQRKVSLRSFFMAQTPVTQAQWNKVVLFPKQELDLEPTPLSNIEGQLPVEKVSWHSAMEFCRRLSKKYGRDYTLPSEAQWEYACRAGTTTPFAFGNNLTPELANYDAGVSYADGPTRERLQQITPVGSFPANAWGLQEMHGNVLEWCLDVWHEHYQGAPIDGSAWLTGASSRLLRGGSWYDFQSNCRSAFRIHMGSDDVRDDVGFRVVCLCDNVP